MTSPATSRRLTTILAADVVGYSRLMAADEEATVGTLRAYRAIIDRLIDRHDGRIFNTAGDSVLAEFGSAVEAVRCAVTIQDELRVRNAELPTERQMLLRIGINIGDVISAGDDLLGDGINVAARLEGLAPPGGVCISGSTFEQVKNKLSIGFEDLGPQAVKNLPDPVAAFRLTGAPVAVSRPAAGEPRRDPTAGRLAAALALVAVVAVVAVAIWQLRPRPLPPPVAPPATAEPGTTPPAPAAPVVPPTPAVRPTLEPPGATPQVTAAPTPTPSVPAPTPVAPPQPVVTSDLPAAAIAALMRDLTIRGTRQNDGQPFVIELHEPGRASYSYPRSGPGAGTTFRANGSWRVADGLFCMQFRGFNQGEEACPVIRREGARLSAHRPNGAALDWSLARTPPGRSAIEPQGEAGSSDDLRAAEIAALVGGLTVHATRKRDGRPFTVVLQPGGTADLALERPGQPPFRERGKWWSEDYRFCMQFTTTNQGAELCPRIVLGAAGPTLTRGDGGPLGWTLSR